MISFWITLVLDLSFTKNAIPLQTNLNYSLDLEPDPFMTDDPTSQVSVLLKNDLFVDMGPVCYYAILVAERNAMESPMFGEWNRTEWPELRNWESSELENGTVLTYQTTPAKWEPFKNGLNVVKYTIGTGECYDLNYCNGPLKERFKYSLKVRAFTQDKYKDTDIVYFETLEHFPVTPICLILFGMILAGAIAVVFSITHFDFIRLPRFVSIKRTTPLATTVLKTYSAGKFLKNANDLFKAEGRLSNEFHLLGTLSSNLTTLCLHGQRIDNRDKNRYGTILPFDVTRVELSLLNGDLTTDYINASFIMGYHQQIEYIAAQGPTKETCHDFFRMIIEQRITLVVMLTDLEENGVELCYKYYPDMGATLKFRDIQVYCRYENEEDFCITRALTVTFGDVIMEVTHLQLEDWPEFKCPKNRRDLVELLSYIRRKPLNGYILVHGTAGAGRTGTFIALDILMQSIRKNYKISVFNTVLELRRQRVNMPEKKGSYGLEITGRFSWMLNLFLPANEKPELADLWMELNGNQELIS